MLLCWNMQFYTYILYSILTMQLQCSGNHCCRLHATLLKCAVAVLWKPMVLLKCWNMQFYTYILYSILSMQLQCSGNHCLCWFFLVQYNSTQFFLEHMQCFAHETFKAIKFCFAYNAVICQKMPLLLRCWTLVKQGPIKSWQFCDFVVFPRIFSHDVLHILPRCLH